MANIDIGKLLIEINLDSGSFSKEIAGINKEIKGLEKQMKNLDKTFGDTSKSMTALETKQETLTKIISKTEDVYKKQVKQKDELVTKMSEEKASLSELTKLQTEYSTNVSKQEEKILGIKNKISKAEEEITSKYSSQIESQNKIIKQYEKEQKALERMQITYGNSAEELEKIEKKKQKIANISSKINQEYYAETKALEQLRQEQVAEEQALKNIKNIYTENEKAIKRTKQAIVDSANQYNKLEQSIEGTEEKIASYNKQQQEVTEQINKLKNGTKDYAEVVEDISTSTEQRLNHLEAEEKILSANEKQWKAYSKVVEQVSTKLQSSIDIYKATQTELSRLTKEEEDLVEQHTELSRVQTTLKQSIQEAVSLYGEESEEVKVLNKQLKANRNLLTENEISQESVTKQIQEQTTSLSRYKKEVAENYQEMQKYGNSKISQSLIKGSNILESIGQKTATASAIGAGVAGGASAMFMEYETGRAKLSTLMDADAKQLDAISQEVKRISNETGMDIGGLMESAYNALSSGIPQNELIGFMETASKMAVAGFTDTESATRLLTQTLNTYGESAGTAEEIADLYAKVQDIGVVSIDELSNCMSESLSLGSAFGVQFEDIGASMVKMTLQGTSASESATQISRLLEELGDSGSKVGEILKDKTGKSFTELMESGMHLDDVLMILQEEADATGVELTSMFGSSNAGRLLCLNI